MYKKICKNKYHEFVNIIQLNFSLDIFTLITEYILLEDRTGYRLLDAKFQVQNVRVRSRPFKSMRTTWVSFHITVTAIVFRPGIFINPREVHYGIPQNI